MLIPRSDMDESYHIADSQLSRLGNSAEKPGSTMELKTWMAGTKPGHNKRGTPQIPKYAACTCLLPASSALVPCMMTLPLSST
jgi:hypothetical protein